MGEIRPYMCTKDARAAIDWYVESMGAEVTEGPIVMDDGRIGHVELSFGGAPLMMSDAYPDLHVEAPAEGRGAAVTLYLTADDVDALDLPRGRRGSHAGPRTRGQRPRADGGVPRPVRPPLDARQHRLNPAGRGGRMLAGGVQDAPGLREGLSLPGARQVTEQD